MVFLCNHCYLYYLLSDSPVFEGNSVSDCRCGNRAAALVRRLCLLTFWLLVMDICLCVFSRNSVAAPQISDRRLRFPIKRLHYHMPQRGHWLWYHMADRTYVQPPRSRILSLSDDINNLFCRLCHAAVYAASNQLPHHKLPGQAFEIHLCNARSGTQHTQ